MADIRPHRSAVVHLRLSFEQAVKLGAALTVRETVQILGVYASDIHDIIIDAVVAAANVCTADDATGADVFASCDRPVQTPRVLLEVPAQLEVADDTP